MLDVVLTPQEQANFNRVLNAMQKVTGAEMSKVVRNTSRDVVREAYKITIMAPKSQSLRTGQRGKYWVRLRHRYTGEKVIFPGTRAQADRYMGGIRTPIKNRGYAKAAWLGALKKLGVSLTKSFPGENKNNASEKGIVSKSETFTNVQYVISNTIEFIQDMDAGKNRFKKALNIQRQAIKRTSNKMVKRIQRMAANTKKKSRT